MPTYKVIVKRTIEQKTELEVSAGSFREASTLAHTIADTRVDWSSIPVNWPEKPRVTHIYLKKD